MPAAPSPLLQRLSNQFFNLLGQSLTPAWDKRLLGLSALPIGTIFDIGANQGQFSRWALKRFPQAQIYAFEPLPVPFAQLERLGRRRPNFRAFPLALGAETDTVAIHNPLYFHAAASLLPTTALCEEVYPMLRAQDMLDAPQRTLDDVLREENLTLAPEILLKLDVQGYEDRVLRGAGQILERTRAVIVEISLDRLYEGQAHCADVFQLLQERGLSYAGNLDQMLARDGHVRYFNALFWRRSD